MNKDTPNNIQHPSVEHPFDTSWSKPNTGYKPPIQILIIGPRNSGKTALINFVIGLSKPRQAPSLTNIHPTNHFYITPPSFIDNYKIKFVDSPGFDDSKDPEEILVGLVEYLAPTAERELPVRLTGILYIHPADEDLASPKLQNRLQRLKTLIGKYYLGRVTILVRSSSDSSQPTADPAQELMSPGSPFLSFYDDIPHPKIQRYKLERQAIEEIIRPYHLLKQSRFDAQEKMTNFSQDKNVKAWTLEDVKQSLQDEPVPTLGEVDSPEAYDPTTNPAKGQTAHVTHTGIVSNGKPTEGGIGNKCDTIEASKNQIDELNRKLEDTRAEYASLRTQLQVHDNIEHGSVVQTFNDINRHIEELGLSVSEHIADNFGNELCSLQDIDPSQLQALRDVLGHMQGKPSLIGSSKGSFPNTEDFLFYAIRALICEKLYKGLFEPFHPSLTTEGSKFQDDFIVRIYKQIARQEPQPVAGRWRKDTFNSIEREKASENAGYNEKIRQAIIDSMTALIKAFIGSKTDNIFTEEHNTMISKLVSTSESWNKLVKGTVVFHGDFQPIYFPYVVDFQADRMLESEGKSNNADLPKVSLATVGLGLVKYNAIGGGCEPKETVIQGALIASERVVFRNG